MVPAAQTSDSFQATWDVAILIPLLWIPLAIAVGAAAHRSGRSFTLYLVLSIVLSPLIGALALVGEKVLGQAARR